MTSCCMESCYYNPMDLLHHLEKGEEEELSPLQYHIKSLQYHIKTLQEEFAKKSNIPWIWRIIYGHKLPYMKKTRKKKQVCCAACFMAAQIKFSKDICPTSRVHSVAPTVLVQSISYLYLLSSNFRRCVVCKVSCKISKCEFLAIFSNF